MAGKAVTPSESDLATWEKKIDAIYTDLGVDDRYLYEKTKISLSSLSSYRRGKVPGRKRSNDFSHWCAFIGIDESEARRLNIVLVGDSLFSAYQVLQELWGTEIWPHAIAALKAMVKTHRLSSNRQTAGKT